MLFYNTILVVFFLFLFVETNIMSLDITAETTVLVNNIKNIIAYIGTTFVTEDRRTSYISKVQPNTFVENIISGYNVFKNKYVSSLPTSVSLPVTAQNIMYRHLDTDMYIDLNASSMLNSFDPANTEINYSKLLVEDSDLLRELNRIRNAYSFLTENNIKLYKSGGSIKISNYVVDNNNKSDVVVAASDLNAVSTIANTPPDNIKLVIGDVSRLDFVTNDVFMIRRLLLLYELLVNIYISMWLYEKNTTSDNDDGYLRNISNTANILISLNRDFSPDSQDDSSNANETILKNLNININKYKENTQTITDINEKVKDLKTILISNENTYNIGTNTRKSASRYEWIILVVYSIAILSIVTIAISGIDRATKLMLLAIVFGVMVVSAITVYAIVSRRIEGFSDCDKKKEGFSNYYLIDPSNFVSGQNTITKDNTLVYYSNAFLSYANDYLNVTLYLGVILQSGKTYSGINNTITREIAYFKKLKQMLDNTENRYKEATALTRLDVITSSARTQFFIYLGIVLALAIMAYVFIGDNIVYQPYIFAVAGLLIIFAIFRYMYTITKHVRRDPVKFYWNRPSNISKID